jgi:hypothetical protein
MRNKYKNWAAVTLTVILTLILVSSCSSLNPFSSPSVPTVQGVVPSTPTSAPVLSQDSLWKFAWLSVLLVFFFPKTRDPLVHLWVQIIKIISIPFVLATDWFTGFRERKKN